MKGQSYQVIYLRSYRTGDSEIDVGWKNPEVKFSALIINIYEFEMTLKESFNLSNEITIFNFVDLTPGTTYFIEVSTVVDDAIVATSEKLRAHTGSARLTFLNLCSDIY